MSGRNLGTEGWKRWRELPTGKCLAHNKMLYKTKKQAKLTPP